MLEFVASFYGQIMEEIKRYSRQDLEQFSYRILQQVAKSMSLPSNVKKIYLVQLIYTKVHGTAEALESIIQKVRYERQLLTQTASNTRRKGKKRLRVQATEISSTNSSAVSPPIDLTPKRAYSPEMIKVRSVVKYGRKNTSDRVLRSYNLKSYKRPNYSIMNNSVVELMKSDQTGQKEKETQISIVSNEGRLPLMNVTARCMLRKAKPASPGPHLREDQVSCVDTQTQTMSSVVPVKRARTLCGMYPSPGAEAPVKTNAECIRAVDFRHTDGKLAKITAVVQKPAPKLAYGTYDVDDKNSFKNVDVTLQDIINSNIDSQTFTNPSVSRCVVSGSNLGVQVPLSDVIPNRMIQNSSEMNAYSAYYHKKIRVEQQLRTKRSQPSLPLPRRTYSRFTATNNLTRPIYVQVGEKEAKILTGPLVPTLLRKVRRPSGIASRDVIKATSEPVVPALQKVLPVNQPPRDDVTGLLSPASVDMKVVTPQSMSAVARRPKRDASRDVTHTQRIVEQKTIAPSLNKMADEQLPVLSDVYSVPTRDVKHIANATADAEDNSYLLACDASPYQHLPEIGDMYCDVTPVVNHQVNVEERAGKLCLPKFSEAFCDATYDVKLIYEPIRKEEEQPSEIPSIPCRMASELQFSATRGVMSKLSDPRDQIRPLHLARTDYPDLAVPWSVGPAGHTLQGGDQPRTLSRAHTSCVYSTRTQPTPLIVPSIYQDPPVHNNSFVPVSQQASYGSTSNEVSMLCDVPFAEQDMTLRSYHEAGTRSNSSVGSTAPTISDIMEDAMDIISQDGDYMERIGMDVRMQCILCSWAGSKIILEYHLRKEHLTQIIQQDKNEWNTTYKLSNLVNQDVWLSHVCDRNSTLYILSVKYEQQDWLLASLTTLSIADPEPKYGTITVYNKVTGEPFSWRGQLPHLPSNMPYENDPNCLRIELSKLNLLPNSANIKLINKELVLSSPAKVIVGQPELNDIHIIVFVQIHDAP